MTNTRLAETIAASAGRDGSTTPVRVPTTGGKAEGEQKRFRPVPPSIVAETQAYSWCPPHLQRKPRRSNVVCEWAEQQTLPRPELVEPDDEAARVMPEAR